MDDTKGTTCAPVYDDGTLRITPTLHPSGIRLEGELDRSGVIGLMAALAAASHIAVQDGGLCHADLSELDFIDVSGLRALITAGAGAGVQVVAVSAAVHRLLRLTGWDKAPGWGHLPAVGLAGARSHADERGPAPVATAADAVDGEG